MRFIATEELLCCCVNLAAMLTLTIIFTCLARWLLIKIALVTILKPIRD